LGGISEGGCPKEIFFTKFKEFAGYCERQKHVDIEKDVIANEVKQSHEIAASLRSSQ